jgi:hypothetical protein
MASEEQAEFESRFARIEVELAAIRKGLAPLKWMVGLAIAPLLAITLKLFLS